MARGWVKSRAGPMSSSTSQKGGLPLKAVSLLRKTSSSRGAGGSPPTLLPQRLDQYEDGTDRPSPQVLRRNKGAEAPTVGTCASSDMDTAKMTADDEPSPPATTNQRTPAGPTPSSRVRPILRRRRESSPGNLEIPSSLSCPAKEEGDPPTKTTTKTRRRRLSWNESVQYALIPPLSEMPPRIRQDLYYTEDEEAEYRAAAKDEIRTLRRHPAVMYVNHRAAQQAQQAAAQKAANESSRSMSDHPLFASRPYHLHPSLSSCMYHTPRGVEHHLLPRDLRRERSSLIKTAVHAVLSDQYAQQEEMEQSLALSPSPSPSPEEQEPGQSRSSSIGSGIDDERLAKVSRRRSRPFRRRAREAGRTDEEEMIAWFNEGAAEEDEAEADGCCDGDNEDDDDEPRRRWDDDDPQDHDPQDHRNSETLDAMVLMDCDDFADVNLDSYASLDQRLEAQCSRELSERLLSKVADYH